MYQEHYIRTLFQTPYVMGCFLWNLNEFYAEPRSGAVPHVNLKGITTLDRKPKNTYWLYKANLTKEPFIRFADSDWTVRSGEVSENHRVKLYSNSKSASLYHNGAKVADVEFEWGTAEIRLPFADGANNLYAVTSDGKAAAVLDIDYRAQNPVLKDGFEELNVLLGSNRCFTEPDQRVCWVPEKEYSEGAWGYVGGRQYRPGQGRGVLPAVEINILGTDNDPMYQTNRTGIEAFKADVPDGKYSVYLHWAELIKANVEALAYNLGRGGVYEEGKTRVFAVEVNGKPVFDRLDILAAVGPARPLVVKTDVIVENGEGLTISFRPLEGETMLTAVRIVKMD